jgi:hypothetical protein
MVMKPELVNTLWFLLILIGMGGALAWYVAHWREFDRDASQEEEAREPDPVTSQLDDDWRDRNWELTLH